MKKIIKILSIGLYIFLFTNINLLAQLLLHDDFQTKNDYWYWRGDGNQSIPKVADGLLHLHLQNGISSEYCNTEIYDPSEPYGPGTQVRVRLKASEIHHGSRGWGFWDGDLTIADLAFDFDVAWVMQQGSDIDDTAYKWFQFGVAGDTINNRQIFELESVVDETNWHTYKIIWDFDKVQFFIDNVFMYETFDHLPDEDMRMDIWIDNRVINKLNPIVFFNNDVENSEMYVDFVEITKLGGPEISREKHDNVILWESPNTFPDGARESLWKEYNFSTNSDGEALIFITGSAESYKGLQNDDDLKISLDEEDFGWDSEDSFDGDNLNGRGNSLIISQVLNSGEHQLMLFSDVTPFLRDVIVLYSEGGKTLFTEKYNEIIDKDDGLWKTINFQSDGSNTFSVLISATVEESEGLRFELDEKNYGWEGQNAFNGDSLNGLPNTVLLNEIANRGEHTLKIFSKGNPEIHSVAAYGMSQITNVHSIEEDSKFIKLNSSPNPFNISTNISYNTIEPSHNKLRIVNILGQEIEILINEFQSQGTYNVQWNANNETSGIYFLILESENNYKVQKLILLK